MSTTTDPDELRRYSEFKTKSRRVRRQIASLIEIARHGRFPGEMDEFAEDDIAKLKDAVEDLRYVLMATETT